MAPIVRMVINLASQKKISQEEQFYYIVVLFTNGRVSDMDALKQAIVEVSYLPVSIVLIGVGPNPPREGEEPADWAPDFSQLVALDADYERMVDEDGYEQARDCVQFLDFTKCRYDEAEFAMQLMAEIPKQIKEFFEEKNIIPRDMEEEILGKKSSGAVGGGGRVNRRDFEINKRKKRAARV